MPSESEVQLITRIREIENLDGSTYPYDTLKMIVPNQKTHHYAVFLCLREGFFNALNTILSFCVNDLDRELEEAAMRVVILDYLATYFVDKSIWDYFLLSDRLQTSYLSSKCCEQRQPHPQTSFLGTFSFVEIASFLRKTLLGNSYLTAEFLKLINLLNEYATSNQAFMDHKVTVKNDSFKMSEVFDLFGLLCESRDKAVQFNPKLLRLMAGFDADKIIDNDSRLRLEAAYCRYFEQLEVGESDFSTLLDIDFNSKTFANAFKDYFGPSIGSAIKDFIVAVIDNHESSHTSTFISSSVTALIYLYPLCDSVLDFYPYLVDIVSELLVHACTGTRRDQLSFLDSIAVAIGEITDQFSPLEMESLKVSERCLRNNHLRGEAMYVMAQHPLYFKALTNKYRSLETSAELYAISNIARNIGFFKDPSLSESLEDPKTVLKYLLDNSGEHLDFKAIENICQLYSVETGTFELVPNAGTTRKVRVYFDSRFNLQLVVAKIKVFPIFDREKCSGEVTAILGYNLKEK